MTAATSPHGIDTGARNALRQSADEPVTQALIAEAPGAVPTTGGVPPEDAGSAAAGNWPQAESKLTDELADCLELLLRALRSVGGHADLGLQQAAEQAVRRLQALEDESATATNSSESSADLASREQALSAAASEISKDISDAARRLIERVQNL